MSIRKTVYQERVITIPAYQRVSVKIYGNWFTILENTIEDVKITFDRGQQTTLKTGIQVKISNNFEAVTEVEFHNYTGAAITLTYAFSNQEIKDSRLTVSGTINTRPEIPDDFDTITDTSVPSGVPTIVIGSGVAKTLFIKNPSSTHAIRVGDGNVSANRGIPLEPGENGIFECSASAYVFQNSGSVMSIPVNYLK